MPGTHYQNLERFWIFVETPTVAYFVLDTALWLYANPAGLANALRQVTLYTDLAAVLPYVIEVLFSPPRAYAARPDFTLGDDVHWPMYFCKSCKAMRFFKLARYVYGWDVLVTTLSDVKGKLAIPLVSRRAQTLFKDICGPLTLCERRSSSS